MEDGAAMFKRLPFHVGVKCMEQSVLEVNESVNDFFSNSNTHTPLNICSWKFPHLKLDKMEVGTMLRNLRKQKLPGDIHYLHLAELLIDRLYFSVLSSIRFTSGLTSLASGGTMCGRLLTSTGVGSDVNFHGLSVISPLCSDTKIFNTNMALVIRHYHAVLLDLESIVHHVVTKLRKYEIATPRGISPRGNSASLISENRETRTGVTQTEITSIECCEVCSMCQEAMKKIGEILESCLTQILPKEVPAITLARADITKSIFTASHWSAITRWCDALENDVKSTQRLALDAHHRNIELDQELKKVNQLLNTNNRDHKISIQKLEKKSVFLESQVQENKKEKAAATELQHFLQEKVLELERKLANKEEELKKETTEKETLQQSFATLEKSHQELKYTQTTHSQTLRRIQQDLLAEQKYKETVQGNVLALESSNRKYRLEIAKLNSDLAALENEKKKLEADSNGLKNQILEVQDKANEKHQTEVEDLKKELKTAEQKIELLTLYPDLNGPINTPESENENVVETMENQLRGNTMRVQVLLQQSEKLASTLKKLKQRSQK